MAADALRARILEEIKRRLALHHTREQIEAAAEEIKARAFYNPGRTRPGLEDTDQSDPNPSGPLYGRLMGPGEENPSLGTRLDTALATTIANPSKLGSRAWRSQMVGNLDRGYSGGLLTRAGRLLAKLPGVEDDLSPEAQAKYAQERPLNPGEAELAMGVGSLLPGSIGRVAGGLTGRAAMGVPAVRGLVTAAPTVGMAGLGAASAAAGAGAQAGADALNRGQGAGEAWTAARAAALDPLNLGLGTAFGALGGIGARTRAGNKNIDLIESRGGEVTATSPGHGGALDTPLVQAGIEKGRVTEAGKGRVAMMGAGGVADAFEARARAVREELEAGKAASFAQGKELVDARPIYEAARAMANDPMVPRPIRRQVQTEVLDDVLAPLVPPERPRPAPRVPVQAELPLPGATPRPGEPSALALPRNPGQTRFQSMEPYMRETRPQSMEPYQGQEWDPVRQRWTGAGDYTPVDQPPPSGAMSQLEMQGGTSRPVPGYGPTGAPREPYQMEMPLRGGHAPDSPPPMLMSAEQANRLKIKLQNMADFHPGGRGASEPHLAGLSRVARHNVGEELGRLNTEAAGKFTELEGSRSAFGIHGEAKEPILAPARESLATRLGRRGADTRTAGKEITPEVEAALERYPELRPYVEAPELLQARGNLEFVGPGGGVGGLYEKLKNMVNRNIDVATVRLLAPLLMGAGRQAPVLGTAADALSRRRKNMQEVRK